MIEDLELWEEILAEVYRYTDAEVLNRLKDLEPILYNQWLKDGRIWIAEALYAHHQAKD